MLQTHDTSAKIYKFLAITAISSGLLYLFYQKSKQSSQKLQISDSKDLAQNFKVSPQVNTFPSKNSIVTFAPNSSQTTYAVGQTNPNTANNNKTYLGHPGATLSNLGNNDPALEIAHINHAMLDTVRETHQTILALKAEIANLKNQVLFVKARKLLLEEQNNASDLRINSSHNSFKTCRSVKSRRFSKSTSKRSKTSNETFPDSDDEIWQDPEASYYSEETSDPMDQILEDIGEESSQDDGQENLVESVSLFEYGDHISPAMIEKFPYINLNLANYNPKPYSKLPNSVFAICLQVDELHYKGDEAVLETFHSLDALLKADEVYIDILWRLCRATLYLSAVSKAHKKMDKYKHYLTLGMEFADQGLKLLDQNLDSEDPEFQITSASPMCKWSASIIGCSAEIVSAIGDKVKNGFKSRDLYKRALSYDNFDYYTHYSLGRWHYEIYMLPSMVKRAANWVSSEPFNSTVQDCLDQMIKGEAVFQNQPPFELLPSDICLLFSKCYSEIRNRAKAKQYIIASKQALDADEAESKFGNLKILDVIEKEEILKIYRSLV